MSIYICPALMDWLAFLIFFAVLYGAGERHMTTAQCAWLGGLFQLTYMISSLAAGSILTRHNARRMLLVSTGLFPLLGILCFMSTRFVPLLVIQGIMGIVFAIFFNAFQTFMRGETVPGSLKRTVGLYTLAWSLGSAFGLFSAGFFYRFGAPALAGLTLLIGGIVFGILLRYRSRPGHETSANDLVDRSSVRPVNPAYVWIGWLIIFTAMFVQRPVFTYFPSLSAQTGISAFLVGIPLALHMALQGLVGYGLCPLRNLLYRKPSLWVFQGGAGLLFLLIWIWPSPVSCFIGISLLGIYTAFAYYTAVFYASNSGQRSFNIGVNECLVGLGSFAGLFAVERWMKHSGDVHAMYLIGGLALLISVGFQLGIAAWGRKVLNYV